MSPEQVVQQEYSILTSENLPEVISERQENLDELTSRIYSFHKKMVDISNGTLVLRNIQDIKHALENNLCSICLDEQGEIVGFVYINLYISTEERDEEGNLVTVKQIITHCTLDDEVEIPETRKIAEVSSLSVSQSASGNGVAGKLLKSLDKRLVECNAKGFQPCAVVMQGNGGAEKTFKKTGWEESDLSKHIPRLLDYPDRKKRVVYVPAEAIDENGEA